MVEHIDLTIIVNGAATQVRVSIDTRIKHVIEKTLEQTSNQGQPPENWELRTDQGEVLHHDKTVEEYQLKSGTRLFLNLKAGIGGTSALHQAVDPQVSLEKFEREVAEYRATEATYRHRGWILVRADFPEIVVAMAAPHLTPIPLLLGVKFDYSNYDAVPPSVVLVNPLTEEPLATKNLPNLLPRAKQQTAAVPIPGAPGILPQFQLIENLLQTYGPDDIPFLCIAGVRQYHQHPAHTGDSWELHRTTGAGRFVRLLEVIYRHGVQPITGYNVNLIPQVSFALPQPAQ